MQFSVWHLTTRNATPALVKKFVHEIQLGAAVFLKQQGASADLFGCWPVAATLTVEQLSVAEATECTVTVGLVQMLLIQLLVLKNGEGSASSLRLLGSPV